MKKRNIAILLLGSLLLSSCQSVKYTEISKTNDSYERLVSEMIEKKNSPHDEIQSGKVDLSISSSARVEGGSENISLDGRTTIDVDLSITLGFDNGLVFAAIEFDDKDNYVTINLVQTANDAYVTVDGNVDYYDENLNPQTLTVDHEIAYLGESLTGVSDNAYESVTSIVDSFGASSSTIDDSSNYSKFELGEDNSYRVTIEQTVENTYQTSEISLVFVIDNEGLFRSFEARQEAVIIVGDSTVETSSTNRLDFEYGVSKPSINVASYTLSSYTFAELYSLGMMMISASIGSMQ